MPHSTSVTRSARSVLALAPVVPVITISDPAHAVPLARALVAGGIPVLEITLRSAHGLDAIRRVRAEVEGAVVGAGTVSNCRELEQALAAGSEFVITPGLTPALLRAGVQCGVPFIPGVATVSELMTGLEQGLDTLKFFPAEAAGGVAVLKAFSGPFPQVCFCPTGGIGPTNMAGYLALPTVLSVGGSWLTPAALVNTGDWAGITALARTATAQVQALRAAGRAAE